MNLIAIDIGNTNITIGLFLKGEEKEAESIHGESREKITKCIKSFWDKIPISKYSKDKKHDGVVIASSVKPNATKMIKQIVKENLNEKLLLIGKDIPFPINLSVKEPEKVGTDRILSAAACYVVTEDAVVIADFGTAVTIDLVDTRGVFLGGCICPGFEISAKALNENTAQLPKINVTKPPKPYGQTTTEAINCGLYYCAIATLQEIVRRYAEETGSWPQTVITGSAAKIIKDDCDFVDSYVPNLVIKGIALAYRKYLEGKSEQ
ncbi:MAG: type III pantothenate kinase [Planctomycetota bacterium]|jgi:type III pantothenate kinase